MQITERDSTFTAQHATGPTHNMLRLQIARGEAVEFDVTVLPSVGDCRHHSGLTAEDVVPAISAGVAAANADLGTNYIILASEIVENDSRQQGIYEYLTRKIIERAAKSEQY